MAEINPIKLQKPLKDKEGSFYPLTTYDQIVMPDNSRWNGVATDERAVFVDRTDATIGDPAPVNADTLGGIPAAAYALKSEIDGTDSSLPSGGIAGQVLVKTNDSVNWADIIWNNITNKPTQFDPTIHTHTSDEIIDSSVETWTFTLDDGSTVIKKVMIVD